MSLLSPEGMELWNRTCQWLGLDQDEVVTPAVGLDGGDHVDEEHKGYEENEAEEEEEVDESLLVEDLSPSGQKRYWAREHRWLHEAMRRLKVEEHPQEKSETDSGVSVPLGGFTCGCDGIRNWHEKIRRIKR